MNGEKKIKEEKRQEEKIKENNFVFSGKKEGGNNLFESCLFFFCFIF